MRLGRGLDGGHAVLEQFACRAPVSLEGELHVLGCHRLAIVELGAVAQDELVDEAVVGEGPRLGEARCEGLARHGLHHSVVQRIQILRA